MTEELKASVNVAAIVGSLRRESLTRRVVQHLRNSAPLGMKIEIVPIGAMPFYNPDQEATAAPEWVSFRDRIKRADAILFATPEYNRSIPAALKNAIDVGSRPYRENAWAKKPAAVISVSPDPTSAFGANHHLRQCLVALDMPTLQEPEAYIGGARDLFDAQGQIADPKRAQLFADFLAAFLQWITRQLD